MKKIIISIASILILLALMYAEYRYIMCNQAPYRGSNGTVYIEIFGQVDEYYAEEAPLEMRLEPIQDSNEYLK